MKCDKLIFYLHILTVGFVASPLVPDDSAATVGTAVGSIVFLLFISVIIVLVVLLVVYKIQRLKCHAFAINLV